MVYSIVNITCQPIRNNVTKQSWLNNQFKAMY